MTILLIAIALIVFAVLIHYYALRAIEKLLAGVDRLLHIQLAVAVICAVIAHVTEVFLFALVWLWLHRAGLVQFNIASPDLMDFFYFSGSTYTTVGYGDIVPLSDGRVLAVVESVVGLVLITWTASYTYFEMSRRSVK